MIDRSKFKPTSVSKMRESDDAVTAAMSKGRGARPGMLDIKPGKNKFRVYPGHPEDDLEEPPFAYPSVKAFLPMMVPDKNKEGEVIGEKEGSKPVFNSRIHGGTALDLVEEYIKLARKWADTNWDPKSKDPKEKQARQNYLDKVYGKYSPNAAQRQMGIQYKTAYVMYADKITGEKADFGRVEVKESVKSRMNFLAGEESSNEPLQVDPYTDLETGRCVVIHYNDKADKPADYYITSIDSDTEADKRTLKMYPISEAQLEHFLKQPTLRSMYDNVFTRKDFELQVKGLLFFDKKNNMGIVGTDDWEALLAEISDYYPEDDTPAEETESQVTEDGGTEAEESQEDDEFAEMTRVELKTFNAQQKLGVVFNPAKSDDDIRKAVKAAWEAKQIPNKPLPGEEKEEKKEEVKKTPLPAGKSNAALDRLKALGKKK
jgi:hypothetical protein